jgi:hypothetical protein
MAVSVMPDSRPMNSKLKYGMPLAFSLKVQLPRA